MRKQLKSLIVAAALAACGFSASAADLYVPPEPAPPQIVYQNFGGWYLRGDIDYHWSSMRGSKYITYPGAGCVVGCIPGDDFDSTDLKGAFSLGVGVGYQINSYLRTDLTGDYWFKSDFTGHSSSAGPCAPGGPCSSTDTSTMSALLLLANAYVDLGTWHGVTPYLGAGIGGAHVKWDDLSTGPAGESSWRFAWAVMAGASYCLTDNLDLDVGYRFSRIEGGPMFAYEPVGGVGPGFDKGFDTHEVRAGLRYQFGAGAGRCGGAQLASYEAPVYK